MIAIAKIGGHQELVKVGDSLEVDKLSAKAGEFITFETLLISEEDGTNFQIGNPFLKDVVEAKVIGHGKGDKIKVFKMKPKKRYRRTQGHRQDYTLIEITKIGGKAVIVKKATTKKVEKKEVVKKETAVKKTVAKKAALKKLEKK